MRLDLSTWIEVGAYLDRSCGIMIPTGSTEQHGPMGLIGTDAICAGTIAEKAGEIAGALVAPAIAYTPAPFNTAFPGTISISEGLFESLLTEIMDGLLSQGFEHLYFLNGHGANLAPLRRAREKFPSTRIHIRNWWDFAPVNELRRIWYGDWEGMHATPSEVAITQATHRVVAPGSAFDPPRRLSAEYVREHAGDRHGPPDEHRARFPDGRVGSHSALATPEQGATLLDVASKAVAEDYLGSCEFQAPSNC
jgi:creatinine amidohydrolase